MPEPNLQLKSEERALHGLRVTASRLPVGSPSWEHIQARIEAQIERVGRLRGGGAQLLLKTRLSRTLRSAHDEYQRNRADRAWFMRSWKWVSPWTPAWMEPGSLDEEIAARRTYLVTVQHAVNDISRLPDFAALVYQARARGDKWASDSDAAWFWFVETFPVDAENIADFEGETNRMAQRAQTERQFKFRHALVDYLNDSYRRDLLRALGASPEMILSVLDQWSAEAKDQLLEAGAVPAGVFDLITRLYGIQMPGAGPGFDEFGPGVSVALRTSFERQATSDDPEEQARLDAERDTLIGETIDRVGARQFNDAIVRALALSSETPDQVVKDVFGPVTSMIWATLMPGFEVSMRLVQGIAARDIALLAGLSEREAAYLGAKMLAGDTGEKPEADWMDVPFLGLEALRLPKIVGGLTKELERGSQFSRTMAELYERERTAGRGLESVPVWQRQAARFRAAQQLRYWGAGVLAGFRGGPQADALAADINRAALNLATMTNPRQSVEAINAFWDVQKKMREIPFNKLTPNEVKEIVGTVRMFNPGMAEDIVRAIEARTQAARTLARVSSPMRRSYAVLLRWLDRLRGGR